MPRRDDHDCRRAPADAVTSPLAVGDRRSGPGGAPLSIEYQPALVEAAVLIAARVLGQERALGQERDPLYEVDGLEEREAGFVRLYARWFERLALHRPLEEGLAERPLIAASCERCVVARLVDRRDEAADLLGAPPARPTLLVRVTADTLAAPDRTTLFLRRELLHVTDMLDPAFGHPSRGRARPDATHAPGSLERTFADAGWPLEVALRDRYGVLWNICVDGRLARAGQAPPTARADRRRDFERAFPELGEDSGAVFERFWRADRCTHTDLLAFARGGGGTRRLCPLCGFPTGGAESAPIPPPVLAAITADFPAWDPAAGVCPRCIEVYAVADRRPAAAGR